MSHAQSRIVELREELAIIDRKLAATPDMRSFWNNARELHLVRMARFARQVFISANGKL